jgi:hypothetical protein
MYRCPVKRIDSYFVPLLAGLLAPLTAQAETQEPPATRVLAPAAASVTVFDQRSLLTRRGQLVLEPSLAVAHASSTEVAIEGLTIIPALVIGLINVSQVQRDITTAAVSLRYGLNDRAEFTFKLPWLHVEESIRERRAFDASPVDILNDSAGTGPGDMEAGLNVQLTNGLGEGVESILNLRVRAPTGEDPFEIRQRPLTDSDGTAIGTVFEEQPTGNGFWGIQPGLSFLYASDPAVLFGNLSWQFNLPDDKGDAAGGRIDPGDALGFGFGIGFALNDKTSFSLGYDHSVVYETKIDQDNDQVDARFNHLHAGSLLVGLSHAVTPERGVNLSLGIGATENAPDVQLTVRSPLVAF